MTYTTSLSILETREFTIHPEDGNHNPAALDGPAPGTVTVAVADPTILSVNRPFGAYIIVSLAPGSTVITLSATSNGVPLVEDINVTVTPVQAVTFGVQFKDPVPKS